jgi:hypothetical protein
MPIKMFGINIIYFLFAMLPAIATVVLIPRKVYKRYFLYGLIFGGIGDTVGTILLSNLNLIKYKNMGEFNVLGIYSIWTPMTCMFIMMLFLYFLPIRRLFLVPYVIAWVGLNWAVGFVMQQFGLFEYIGIYKYFAPLTFLLWYSGSAWIYLRAGDVYKV